MKNTKPPSRAQGRALANIGGALEKLVAHDALESVLRKLRDHDC